MVKHVSDTSFKDDVLGSEGPILVDFWAPWCGPCRQVAPILEDLVGELGGKITLAKVNVDDEPQTATSLGIRGIPTLMIFKGGEVVATKVGAAPKAQLRAWINDAI